MNMRLLILATLLTGCACYHTQSPALIVTGPDGQPKVIDNPRANEKVCYYGIGAAAGIVPLFTPEEIQKCTQSEACSREMIDAAREMQPGPPRVPVFCSRIGQDWVCR